MNRHIRNLIIMVLEVSLLPLVVLSQIPKILSFQGVMTDSVNKPLPDGNYAVTFRMYTISSGGIALWTETEAVVLNHGICIATLGEVTPFQESIKWDRLYWVGISINNGSEMTPRVPLSVVPYSIHSIKSESSAISEKIVSGNIKVSDLNQSGATLGQIIRWDGNKWTPMSDGGSGVLGMNIFLGHDDTLGWKFGKGDTPITLTSNGQALELNKELRIRSAGGDAALFGVSNTNGNLRAFASDRPIDKFNLFEITVDGQHWWGGGSQGGDVHLYRSKASELTLNGNLLLVGETNITSPGFRVSSLQTAPASSSSPGTTGEIRITADYIYICKATNVWVRAALTSW